MLQRLPEQCVEPGRRQFLLRVATFSVLGVMGAGFGEKVLAEGHARSIAALKEGVVAESRAHHRYVTFGRHAKEEGYRGLAYLYTALATSELIHAQNYIRVLAMLGELARRPAPGEVRLGTAQENLIYAAEREMHSIEQTYPKLQQTVDAEGHADAITVVRYCWASHKQHLDIIEKIRRWSPGFFESVARKIDEKTDRYHVCQVCGSTVTEVPEAGCPVCKEPASKYRLIAHDRFF